MAPESGDVTTAGSGGLLSTEEPPAPAPGRTGAPRFGRIKTFTLALLIVLIDQAAKAALISALPIGGAQVTPLFNFRRVHNFGINFGLFADHPGSILIVTAAIGAGFVGYVLARPPGRWWTTLGFGLLLGGGFGNLVDRLRLGYVFDFLNITPFVGYLNLADLAIGLGIILLATQGFWRGERS